MQLLAYVCWCAAALQPPRYVVVYRGAHGGFRVPEFDAARAGISGATLAPADETMAFSRARRHCGGDVGPPLFMAASNATAAELAAVAARSVLVRAVLELWGSGPTYGAAAEDAAARGFAPLAGTWRVCSMKVGAARGKTGGAALRSLSDRKVLGELEPVLARLDGPVDLSEAADETVLVACDYDRAVDDHAHERPDPRTVYVGRLVARGDRATRLKFSLKTRPFVGTTTMDPETAALMARLARLEPGMAAVDPFAGTCGCLLAATHLTGAAATAADVDGDALRGALANFDAAGLPRPTILECPVDALVGRLGGAAFDAIVTDPPYGKRERIAGGDARWLEELLGLADDALKVGGRCVFFVPHGDDASADDVAARVAARAPGYAVEASAQQRLSGPWRRTLVVLRKETSAARSTKGGARDDLGAELSDYWKGRRAAVEAGRGTRGTH